MMAAEPTQQAIGNKAVATTGVAAAGASSAPTPLYGTFLNDHGLMALSYAEWIQVIGCIYVLTLLYKMTGLNKVVDCVISKIKKLKGK